MAGMFAQFLVSAFLVVAVPAGDAYLFMLSSKPHSLMMFEHSSRTYSVIISTVVDQHPRLGRVALAAHSQSRLGEIV